MGCAQSTWSRESTGDEASPNGAAHFSRISVRKLDPALVTTVAGHIGRISDLLRDVVEHPAASHGAVVVYEGLTADHLHPPRPPEILTGDAAPLPQIDKFKHDLIHHCSFDRTLKLSLLKIAIFL